MITEKEWQNLKVGDHIWYVHQDAVEPVKIIISRITQDKFYSDKYSFSKNNHLFWARLSNAIWIINFRLKIQIEKIQAQIKSNLNMKE